jgi:hypothetical protein
LRIFSHKTPIGQRLDESNHTVTNAGCFVNPNGLNGAVPIPELITSLVGGTSASVASGPPASSNPFGPLQSSLASLGLGGNPVGSLSTLLGGTPLADLTSALSGTPLGSLTFSGFRGSPYNSLTSALGGSGSASNPLSMLTGARSGVTSGSSDSGGSGRALAPMTALADQLTGTFSSAAGSTSGAGTATSGLTIVLGGLLPLSHK